MRPRSRLYPALPVILLVISAGSCSRQREVGTEFPNRPLRLVVPFNAGGGTDAYARVMAKAIEDHKLLPQPIAIVNVGGAGATHGSRKVRDARPDGHTILILHDAILTAQLSGAVSYGPESFQPIAGTGQQGMVIAVRDDSPYRSLNDLLAAAKRKPKTLNFGANLGALTHYAGLLMEQKSDAKFVFIQLGGGADRFAKLIGGHVDVTGFSTEEFVRFKSKGLRGLAIFSEKRHDAIPGVATANEQRIPIVLSNTFYWWAPKHTPKERVEVIAEALRRAVNTPDVRKRLIAMHCEPIFVRGKELENRIEHSREVYGGVSPEQPDLPDFVAIAIGAIAVLAALRIAWWFYERRQKPLVPVPQPSNDVKPRVGTAAAVMGLCCVYFAALAREWLTFPVATLLFVAMSGLLLIRWNTRSLVTLAGLAVVMAFGLHEVLIRVFHVDFAS